MTKRFYITKTFTKSEVTETADDDDFLGKIKGIVSTTHKDRQGDILTRNFVKGVTKNMKENTAVFYNHKTDEDPIAKILSAKTVKMEEKTKAEMLNDKDIYHYGAEVEIGISKTAEKQWILINEGILNKFSIGGYILDYEWDDDKEAFIVDTGDIFESSLVGIPANAHASLSDVLKVLRKDYLAKKIETDKKGEFDMDKDEFDSVLKKALEDQEAKFDEKIAEMEKANKPVVETEEDKLRKELEKYAEVNAKREADIARLNKELEKKEGRKTGASHDLKDPYFIKDIKMALNKGLMEFGEVMKEGDFEITFIDGNVKGIFTEDIRKGVL